MLISYYNETGRGAEAMLLSYVADDYFVDSRVREAHTSALEAYDEEFATLAADDALKFAPVAEAYNVKARFSSRNYGEVHVHVFCKHACVPY